MPIFSCGMKLQHLSLLIAFLGVISLYIISTLIEPIPISLDNLPKYEGKQVIVQGIVIDHYVTSSSYGNQIIVIQQDNSTATIFIEGGEKNLLYCGDKIQVTGKVQRYKDKWEILVSDTHFIRVIQQWQNISRPLWEIAENPTYFTGLNLNVTGYIDAVFDTYFFLSDATGEHVIFVTHTPSSNISIYTGEKIILRAYFTYDAAQLRYKFEIKDENHGILQVEEG